MRTYTLSCAHIRSHHASIHYTIKWKARIYAPMRVYTLPPCAHMCVQKKTTDLSRVPFTQATVQMVVRSKRLFNKFVEFWSEHLPDITDYPSIEPQQLQFWMRNTKKKSRKKPHRQFPGLCAQFLNEVVPTLAHPPTHKHTQTRTHTTPHTTHQGNRFRDLDELLAG